MKRFECRAVFAAVALLAGLGASAQVSTVITDGTTPPAVAPGSPAGSYALSGFETVNLYNGKLNFALPVYTVKGRGEVSHTLQVAVQRNWRIQDSYNPQGNVVAQGAIDTWWTGNQPYSAGRMLTRTAAATTRLTTGPTCWIVVEALTRLTFAGSDGSEVELLDSKTNGKSRKKPNVNSCDNEVFPDRGKVFQSVDGSGLTFVADQVVYDNNYASNGQEDATSEGVISGNLYFRDGIRIQFSNGVAVAKWDRNGNKISFTHDCTLGPCRVTGITDPLGRQITVAYNFPTLPSQPTSEQLDAWEGTETITFPGGGNASRTVTLVYRQLSGTAATPTLRNPYMLQTFQQLFIGETIVSSTDVYRPRVVSEVRLPNYGTDSTQRYLLQYNSYGELARVELPTGGAYEYDHGSGLNSGDGPGVNGLGQVCRRVRERRVYGRNGQLLAKEAYTPNYTSGAGDVTVKTLAADDTVLSNRKHYFIGDAKAGGASLPFRFATWNEGKESQTDEMDSGGTVLRSEQNRWDQLPPDTGTYLGGVPPPNNPRLVQVLRTVNGRVTSEVYCHDTFVNQTARYEYGIGYAGGIGTTYCLAPLYNTPPAGYARLTETAYETSSTYTNANMSVDTPPGWGGDNGMMHLRSLPVRVKISGPLGLEADTENIVDGGTAGVGFSTDRGAVTGNESPSRSRRGNITKARRWVETTAQGAVWRETSMAYDSLGNVTAVQLPRGNTWAVSYQKGDGSRCDGGTGGNVFAFPCVIQNGAGEKTEKTFDFGTGLVTWFKGVNGHTIGYQYNDGLDRLTGSTPAVGNGVSISYTPGLPRTVTVSQAIGGNCQTGSMQKEVEYDGLGRTVRESVFNGSWSRVFTEYDGLGRVKRKSVPVYGLSGTNWAETQYDALGRVVSATAPGAAVTTYEHNFAGSAGTVEVVRITDPAGKRIVQERDGLGRMTKVTEDPAMPGDAPGTARLMYETLYGYDGRGNLLTVTPVAAAGTAAQAPRQFSYNGVGELKAATQPESGTTAYVYDGNGNLSKKTDGRLQIVNYVYDNADRLTNKSYEISAGTASPVTPGASWSYYGPSENCTGTAILCAGLLKKAEATGTVVGNNAFTTLAEYLYDAKGRMTESKQTTSGKWGAAPVIGLVKYGYNGADQEEEVTYPSGRTVRSCGNEAGQPLSVSGLAGVGIAAKTYATGGLYEADGGLKEITIGALKETRGYNGKRQVESIGLANAGAGVWNLTNYYCATGLNILDCGANNGNVMRQVIQQPKPPSVGGSVTFTVDYGYDGANRLTSVGEALLTDGTQQAYGQTFGYDQYGNRWMKTMTPAMPGGTPNGPSWINGKNQVAGVGTVYDDAGNLQVLGSGSHEFKWDGEGRKVEDAITSGATTYLTWYAYDAEGRRVRKQGSNGAWTVYVYDGRGRVRAEYGSVAETETSTKYLYGDHLGSTRVVADGSGAVKGRYDYLPFGEEVEAGWNGRSGLEYGSGGGVAQRYTGKERDEGAMESRMDYFGARYLNAGWGRFVSADRPFADQRIENPQSWNRYVYARNAPLLFVDDDGRASVEYLRRKAVRLAREQERDLIRRTGAGTTRWSDAELKLIREGGWPEGYFGHHINNVKHHPELAGEPGNVKFMDFDDHMTAHNRGKTRVRTTGPLLARSTGIVDILQAVVGGISEFREAQITGVMESTSPLSFGETFIVDANNAAQTLDGAVIRVGGANGDMYRVSNGQYFRFGCVGGSRKCRQNSEAMNGVNFEIIDPSTLH